MPRLRVWRWPTCERLVHDWEGARHRANSRSRCRVMAPKWRRCPRWRYRTALDPVEINQMSGATTRKVNSASATARRQAARCIVEAAAGKARMWSPYRQVRTTVVRKGRGPRAFQNGRVFPGSILSPFRAGFRLEPHAGGERLTCRFPQAPVCARPRYPSGRSIAKRSRATAAFGGFAAGRALPTAPARVP